MQIGAHVSTAGGVDKAVARGVEIGAECIQVFASSPRAWKAPPLDEGAVNRYHEEMTRARLGPTAIHGKYLVALGSEDEALLERSVAALVSDLQAAEKLGALGVIFHPASHRGRGLDAVFDQFIDALGRILHEVPGKSLLMLETSAGSGDHIGSKFEEIGRLVKAADNPRIAVCIDTQHVWAAGYDIAHKDSLDSTLEEFDRQIGLDLLKAVHANDSKRELGSAVDRHENIGLGLIGTAGFEVIMAHPALADVPFYLEVPGIEGGGPDAPNVEALKSIRNGA